MERVLSLGAVQEKVLCEVWGEKNLSKRKPIWSKVRSLTGLASFLSKILVLISCYNTG